MKKTISLTLILSLLFLLAVPAFAAENKPLSYLLLGDSITEGYGVMNREEACYGRIVADTNGYEYENLARGDDSASLLEFLDEDYTYTYYDYVYDEGFDDSAYDENPDATTEEEPPFTVNEHTYHFCTRESIEAADIISISVGGNDFLCHPEVVKLALFAIFGVNRKALDEVAETYYENLCAIIGKIKDWNPQAVILMQTVPCVWNGVAARANRACADRVNAMIKRYDETHPGMIHVCDISPAMNGHPENLADDCVHPNAAGNVAIAEIVLRQLFELGLGSATTPVVNTAGIDWNFFEEYFWKEPQKAKLVEIVVKLLTGNSVNLNRKAV